MHPSVIQYWIILINTFFITLPLWMQVYCMSGSTQVWFWHKSVCGEKVKINQSRDLWGWLFTPNIATELEGSLWAEICQWLILPQPQPQFQIVGSRRLFTKWQNYVWLCENSHNPHVNKSKSTTDRQSSVEVMVCGTILQCSFFSVSIYETCYHTILF